MKQEDHNTQHNTEELFAALFRNAASRSRPPAGEEERIRQSLHTQWRQLSQRRHRFRLTAMLGAAASVVLAVYFVAVFYDGPAGVDSSRVLANVLRHAGSPTVGETASTEPARVIGADEMLTSGSVIATGRSGRLAIRWLDGESVRLDHHTRIILKSESTIHLLSGRVYIDSGSPETGVNSAGRLAIETSFGRVNHIGTRYMAELEDSGVLVSVSQGRVAVMADRVETIANTGQQLSVDAQGLVETNTIPGHDRYWDWVQEISPVFELDGRTMADFLAWVSRESGRSLEYATSEAETLAHETIMRGTVTLQPARALDLMLQTSDLQARLYDGMISIDTR